MIREPARESDQMLTVFLTKGLQASGKSTWAREWVKEKPGERKRLNRDELRLMLDAGEWSPENEKFILKVRDSLLLQALRAGKSVVIDDTNLRADNFTKVCTLVASAGLTAFITEKPFPIDLDEAIARDAARGQKGGVSVGEKVIRDTWKRYIGKHGSLGAARSEQITPKVISGVVIEHIEGVPNAIICDLDGTLALMGDRSPFDASRCDELDLPNNPVIECVKAMYHRGYEIIFMSGRQDKDREPTERFIAKHCTVEYFNPHANEKSIDEVIPHKLFMRATGDQRKDSMVKRELFDAHIRDRYNIAFTIDDRDQVVETWRAMGLTCLQCALGAF